MLKKDKKLEWPIVTGWVFLAIQLAGLYGHFTDPRGVMVYKFTLLGVAIITAEAIGFSIFSLIAIIIGLILWKGYKNDIGKYLTFTSAGLLIITVGIFLFANLLGNITE